MRSSRDSTLTNRKLFIHQLVFRSKNYGPVDLMMKNNSGNILIQNYSLSLLRIDKKQNSQISTLFTWSLSNIFPEDFPTNHSRSASKTQRDSSEEDIIFIFRTDIVDYYSPTSPMYRNTHRSFFMVIEIQYPLNLHLVESRLLNIRCSGDSNLHEI